MILIDESVFVSVIKLRGFFGICEFSNVLVDVVIEMVFVFCLFLENIRKRYIVLGFRLDSSIFKVFFDVFIFL